MIEVILTKLNRENFSWEIIYSSSRDILELLEIFNIEVSFWVIQKNFPRIFEDEPFNFETSISLPVTVVIMEENIFSPTYVASGPW